MTITNIKITKSQPESNLKAYADVVIDNQFVIHGVRVIEASGKTFIAMPQKIEYDKNTDTKEFFDICHPLNTKTREYMQDAVLTAYYKFINTNE